MKVYTCYTASHKVFLPYFLDYIPNEDNLEITMEELPQACHSGVYMEKGWIATIKERATKIVGYLKRGEPIIFTDVDVQFFRPFKFIVDNYLNRCDIAFQEDSKNDACAGFFIANSNNKTIDFFENIANTIRPNFHDQQAMNYILTSKNHNLNYEFLPKQFFWNCAPNIWNPSLKLPIIPNSIIMHHANWVVGIQNKLVMLDKVREKMESLRF